MSDENLYRVRAERGEVQIINCPSDAAVLRARYASTVPEIRRALPARPGVRARPRTRSS
ncbi:MAG TPA: hypothetical protein VIF11_20865 [Methylomirabilota bacterium]|jgi:hypothetical protein